MMTGLPGYGPARPTGRTIFRALADLRLIPAHDGNPATIPKPAGIQARLLDLLNIDISRPAGSTRKTPCAKNGSNKLIMSWDWCRPTSEIGILCSQPVCSGRSGTILQSPVSCSCIDIKPYES